jgi:hypothetical protein
MVGRVTKRRSKLARKQNKRKSKSKRSQRGGNIGARGIPQGAVVANPMPLDTSEGGYTNDI